jgi:hypothetical protein
MNRLKTATALALLNGHAHVDDEDWRLAGIVMDVSDATRSSVAGTLRATVKEQSAARGRADGERAVVVEEIKTKAAVKRIGRTLLRKLDSTTWTAGGALRKRLSGDDRRYFEDAVEHLVGAGLVEATEGEYRGNRSTQYRLCKAGS